MNAVDKNQQVEQIGEVFKTSAGAFLVSISGCQTKDVTLLRRELNKSGAKLKVVKNTLTSRAVTGTNAEKLNDYLAGPTAIIWAKEDAITSAKIVSKFAKDNENFSIKAGFIDGTVVGEDGVKSLATMPSKEELYAKLLALINAPATQLVRMLNAPASSLVRLLEAWRAEKEKQGQ